MLMLKSFWVIKKKESWEMWRKALSNYSVYLGSSWWNIYITVMEVLRVIKSATWVSSLFPHFSSLLVKETTNMWTKPLFLMMELLCRRAAARRLTEWLLFYSILSEYYLYPFELERVQHSSEQSYGGSGGVNKLLRSPLHAAFTLS